MATKNPFEKLKVTRDDDDEDTVQVSSTQQSATAQNVVGGKKKKIRPDEKQKLEEQSNVQEDDSKDFKEIKKQKNPKGEFIVSEDYKNQTGKEHHIKNKGAFEERNAVRGRGKRQFDRRSGTGRGKEVAKQGAGSGTVWGSDEQVAKTEIEHRQDYYEDYNDDDKYFNIALNEKKPLEPVAEEKKEEKVEETPVVENQEEKGRRRKGKGKEEEEKVEPKIEVPDNSLSYKEYKEQKNKTKTDVKPIEPVKKVDETLKPKEKQANEAIGIEGKAAKKTQKAKVVTENNLEKKLNQIVSEKAVENTGFSNGYQNNRQGGNKKGYQKENKGFVFKKEEFPEL